MEWGFWNEGSSAIFLSAEHVNLIFVGFLERISSCANKDCVHAKSFSQPLCRSSAAIVSSACTFNINDIASLGIAIVKLERFFIGRMGENELFSTLIGFVYLN